MALAWGAPNPNLNPNPNPNPNPNQAAPSTMALAWGAPPPSGAPFELVVGTDLFYAREAMGLLVRC